MFDGVKIPVLFAPAAHDVQSSSASYRYLMHAYYRFPPDYDTACVSDLARVVEEQAKDDPNFAKTLQIQGYDQGEGLRVLVYEVGLIRLRHRTRCLPFTVLVDTPEYAHTFLSDL